MKKIVFMDLSIPQFTDGSKVYKMSLSGETYEHKGEIKAMGFKWDGCMCWEKTVSYTTKEAMVADINSYLKSGFIKPGSGWDATCKKLWN